MSYNHYPKNLWTPDDIKDMVNDWLADNAEITDLVIDGEPYYEPDIWQPDGIRIASMGVGSKMLMMISVFTRLLPMMMVTWKYIHEIQTQWTLRGVDITMSKFITPNRSTPSMPKCQTGFSSTFIL